MEQEKITGLKAAIASRLNRPMRWHLDLCTRCGLCYDTCHAYYGIPRREYSPVGRAEVVRKIYKKYFRPSGRFIPSWGEATAIDDHVMDEVREAAFSCTGCRRCMMYCPFGIDTPHILSIAKLLLIAHGTAPDELVMLADSAVEKGRSIDEFKEGYRSVIADLQSEVKERLSLPSAEGLIPMEKKGARILYVGLAGAHSIVHPAVIFNAAKEDWTLSYFEAVNFGYFAGDPEKTQFIADRIINEAVQLGVREVVIVECGTAFRIPRFLMGPLPFKVTSIVEKIHQYLKAGRIRIRQGAIGTPLTYHDPCQMARFLGLTEAPRQVLQAIKGITLVEPEWVSRQWSTCCGGGGGFEAVFPELSQMLAVNRAQELADTGAQAIVTSCPGCIMQLKGGLKQLGKEEVEVLDLAQVVAASLGV